MDFVIIKIALAITNNDICIPVFLTYLIKLLRHGRK